MLKRKTIYISIAISCSMVLFLSVMGFLPDIFLERTAKEPSERKPLETELIRKPPASDGYSKTEEMNISQSIEGLYLPTYDEAGREQLVLRGERAVFIDKRIYKITNPIIDVYFVPEGKPSENSLHVTITSLHGEMDKLTNIGILYDDAVIKLTKTMNAYTDNLKYEPNKRRIHTDDTVTILGEKMKVVGKGFAADLAEQKTQIKSDVEFDIESTLGETGVESSQRQRIHITSGGPFEFEKRTNTAKFLSSARVTRGTLTLLADNLILHLDPDTGKLTQLVANGNVLLTEDPIVANADILRWDAASQIITLEGYGPHKAKGIGSAELLEKNTSIVSSQIILNQNTNSIKVPAEGRLVAKLKGQEEHSSPSITNVTWKGSMSFSKEKQEALFKKDVELTRDGSQINCGILLVNFDADNSSIKTLKASRAVHIVETKGKLKREAKASQVIMEPGGSLVEMVAEPYAWVKEGNRQITAPYIMFFDNGQKIICEGAGNLSIKPDNKEEGEDAGLKTGAEDSLLTETVDVSWIERMVFDQSQHRALFHGGVKTVKDEQNMESDQLDVLFSGNNTINKIIATGNVYFEDLRNGGVVCVGDIATWDYNLDFIVLGGDPKAELRRDNTRSFSRLISYDIHSQRISWEKDTHLQIPFSR